MNAQQKNIAKTVLILCVIMVTFVSLFVHKLTTPRHLSEIELRINGLVLDEHPLIDFPVEFSGKNKWILVLSDGDNKSFFESVQKNLRDHIGQQLVLVLQEDQWRDDKKQAFLFKPSGDYIAYLKPPFEERKAILTLSSVITHR